MKLELLDSYNIRARLSASIILLAPIAISLFFLFEEIKSFSNSSIIIFVLLAFTNYIPIMQRWLNRKKTGLVNYAAQFLLLKDNTFDNTSKMRFYKKLSSLDDAFVLLENPDDSEEFKKCCKSAVIYIRSRTRDNKLVLEENINYGFCKNLMANKAAGIIICLICSTFVAVFSILKYDSMSAIPIQNYFAFFADIILFLFWVFGINKKILKDSAIQYAKALLMAIDTL